MSFQFNFPHPENGPSEGEQPLQETEEDDDSLENLEECQEVLGTTDGITLDPDCPFIVYDIDSDLCIKCLDSQEVERSLCRSRSEKCGVVKAAESHSDLIPNVYEGGLKVWECAVDLVKYLHKNHINFKDCKVLDLGCGSGLPGILAALKGAKEVHFQDYNSEVLQHYTVPNLNLNITDSEGEGNQRCRCRFFSGDWTSFSNHIGKEKVWYDFILTAETIYKPDNYGKLTHIFNTHLNEDGTVYVAAKSNYFGVGGGTEDFKTFLNKEDVFELTGSFETEEGIPRDIFVLKRQHRRKKRKREVE